MSDYYLSLESPPHIPNVIMHSTFSVKKKRETFEIMTLCHNSKNSACSCRTDTYPKLEMYTINLQSMKPYYRSSMCGSGNKQTDGHQAILAFTNPNKWTKTKEKIQEFHTDRSQLVS